MTGGEGGAAQRLMDEMGRLAETRDEVSVGDLVGVVGHRGFGPLFFAPALIAVSPLGAVPGVPTSCALLIVLVAVQILMNRGTIWMPPVLSRRSVPADRVSRAMDKARPAAAWMDRHFGRRLRALTTMPARLAAAAAVLALCLMVPPLELIPFAAAIPMAAVAVIGLAITAGDGILMLVGLGAAAAALITGWSMVISG